MSQQDDLHSPLIGSNEEEKPDRPRYEDEPDSDEEATRAKVNQIQKSSASVSVAAMDTDDDSLCRKDRKKNIADVALEKLHKFFMSLPVQIIMVFVTLIDITFLILEFVQDSYTFEAVTLVTASSFFIELIIHLGHQGKNFFKIDKPWMIAEVVIVTSSFLVEYLEFILRTALPASDLHGYLRYMRAVRFFRVFILWRTRGRKMMMALRRLVSADRRRFQEDGYDLDLTYVAPHIIAMSWPSSDVEAFYRNHIDTVADFLDKRHPGAYRVYNLCSERQYDETKFHDRVTRYRVDDHNPCELMMMKQFGEDVDRHLKQDTSRNVAVIHCKGGKGRTGTMVCVYLLYSKMEPNAEAALRRFGETRTAASAKSFQGVESPSQERFVHYYDRLLKQPQPVPPTRWVKIRKLRINSLPPNYWDVGRLWFVLVTEPNTRRVLHYKSNPMVTFDTAVPPWDEKKRSKSMMDRGDKGNDDEGDEDYGASPLAQPFHGNKVMYVNESPNRAPNADPFDDSGCEPIDFESFEAKHLGGGGSNENLSKSGSPSSSGFRGGKKGDDKKAMKALMESVRVDIEYNTSSIPAFQNDVTFKLFFNVDNPSTLSSPVQVWLHPSYEGNVMKLTKGQVDGPHKDHKHKKFPKNFAFEIELETTSEPPPHAGRSAPSASPLAPSSSGQQQQPDPQATVDRRNSDI